MKLKSFMARIERVESGCWLWRGNLGRDGYGKIKGRGAHRFAYRLFRGEIPQGLEIDHLCRVTNCVNPDHLEVVTHLENMRRRNALVTHCKHGHEFTEANTYRRENRRDCRACNRAAVARLKARKTAGATA